MKKLAFLTLAAILVATIILSACSASTMPPPSYQTSSPSTVQRPGTIPSTGAPPPADYGRPAPPNSGYPLPKPPTGPNDTIGFAVGGAKDINNFRDNIRNGYLPAPTDVSYEGLFYDYFFDTGQMEPTNKLFAPSYSTAVTRDPFSRQTEYYLAVGLNSGMKERDFQRKKLNLSIVLDNSGSMNENYTQYYYDRFGVRQDAYAAEGLQRQRKMDSANEAVATILDQLRSDDRFSVVLFNSNALLFKSMGPVRGLNMRAMTNNVRDVMAGGSTNLMAGLDLGTAQFRGLYEANSYEYENRIILITDAQPNTGEFSVAGLFDAVRRNADRRIYTTFIGIGVDFNTELINELTKIKGANYYSVHSPKEFRSRVNDEFDYMVTPLVFNLRLTFQSQGWRIDKVFGSPEADQSRGELMRINTLFPSKKEDGETRGGLVLLKLSKTSSEPGDSAYLRVTYEDRDGRMDSSEEVIALDRESPEYFSNNGIRKGVLLVRYASLLRNWMIDERQYKSRPSWNASVGDRDGIVIPAANLVSQWERQSMALTVSDPYRRLFRDFSRYFDDEMAAVRDNDLNQELKILDKLSRL